MAIQIKLRDGETFGITDRMTGKMEGMWSLNTSPSTNPFCLEMRKNPHYICKSCYTKGSEGRWAGTREAWAHNGAVLASRRLTNSEIPLLSARKSAPIIFRFQAHGDLMNTTHYRNLIKIAKLNPDTMFAIWTKNLNVVWKVGIPKLDNMIHIYSTPLLDQLRPTLPTGFDKVFSVFTRPYVAENDVDINCGARECFTCRLCYTHNSTVYVNELIKSNGHKGDK